MSNDPKVFEIIIHAKDSFCERLDCENLQNKNNLVGIIEALLTNQGLSYNFFVSQNKKLNKFVTSKSDAEKKKFKRPDEEFLDLNRNP